MRTVAGQAVSFGKGLSLVRLHQAGFLHIVTVDAQRGSVLGQVKIKFAFAPFPRLVHGVAGVATRVQRSVAAAPIRRIRPLRVASQAEIVFLIARGELQQLILVVGGVRIVAGQAIANRRRVHFTLDLGGIFIGVAGEAELVRSGGDQLYVSVISIDPDFMAAQAAHRYRGMDGLALGFVFMTRDAGRGIGLRVKRYRMLRGEGRTTKYNDHE